MRSGGTLPHLYERIVIPPAVERELALHIPRLDQSWTSVVEARNRNEVRVLRERLDPGEAEAIVAASELGAGLLLIDEKIGRAIAKSRGLEVTGLLGVSAEAKDSGFYPTMPARARRHDPARRLLDRLRFSCGYHMWPIP